MTNKMKGLLNSAKKIATLTNFLIITIVCILVYFIYQLVKKCNFNDPIQEGFVAQKELTDLLDKLRIKLYEKESVWSNELFNQQPGIKKEKEASFWEPKNETGQPFKKVGQCISIEENYDMPGENTMLIDGDVKPPKDVKFLFQFHGNSISNHEKDSSNYNEYTGIRSLKDIEDRINQLNDSLDKLNDLKTKQETHLENLKKELKDEFFIKLYKKDEFFNNTPTYSVKNNNSEFTIPPGKYSSISIPFGSKISLFSEKGTQPLNIDLPLSLLMDSNNNPKPLTNELYNEIMAHVGLNGDDFNIFGKYGFGAVQHYGYGKTNDKNKSSSEQDFNQSTEDIYAPTNHSEAAGEGFSRILLFTNIERELNYSYNYAVSNNEEHGNYGRTDLYNFAKKLSEQSNKIKPLTIYGKDNNFINFSNKPVYNLYDKSKVIPLNTTENFIDFSNATCQDTTSSGITSTQEDTSGSNGSTSDDNVISHPYLTENQNKQLLINIDNLSKFKNNIEELNNKYFWCNIPIDNINIGESCQTNQKILTVDLEGKGMYYLNLAFMYTTMKKMLKRTGEFATDIDSYGGSCCEIAEVTEESLSRRPNFQGYVTTGLLKLNIEDKQHPLIIHLNNIEKQITDPMTKAIADISTKKTQLQNLQKDINDGKFTHFPIKIYRPIPEKNYVSLGDVLFNHRHTNYSLPYPILDNIATIPKQCYKEVRDWLSVDKVYEYSNGDTYLAIFKNPYLQTFKAVTVPETLPPGRVGKVVACVEGCRLLDDIIEADKCSKKFFKANKEIIEGINLDPDNTIISRESTLYKNKIQDKQDRINTLKEVARRLQIQDDKANIINRQYNKQQLQNLVDTQRRNINTLVDELQDGKNRIDVNVKFSYEKFQGLITILRENNSLPPSVANRITDIVDNSARQKVDTLSDEDVKEVLASCPTPETEGLVVKALVESACFNCYNLK